MSPRLRISKLKVVVGACVLGASSACAALVGLDKDYTDCGSSPCVDATPSATTTSSTPDVVVPPPDASPDVLVPPPDAEAGCPGFADAASTGLDDAMVQFAIPPPLALPTGRDRFDGGADGGAETVYDSVTGLTWEHYAIDVPDQGELDYEGARIYCANLRLDGHSDWRIPTRGELISLTDYRYEFPSLDQAIFPPKFDEITGAVVPRGNFWTSTPAAGNPGSVWIVGTNDGYFTVTERTCNAAAGGCIHVRCVR